MPQFLRCPRFVLKIFLIFLSSFYVISKNKVITLTKASFSPVLCCSSKKKKVLRLSFASFLHALCNMQQRGAVNCSCLLFLAGNKNAGFWWEKKGRYLQKFSAKMLEKILHFSHFFALIGNTVSRYHF